MTDPTELHPPLSPIKITRHPDDGDTYLLNIPACIRIAREGETEKSRILYRTYVAEYRALAGSPLTHEERETTA